MVKIVNIVASQRLAQSIDINDVADCLEIDYEQEQFPGMVYRTQTPKVCVLLFRSGKAVATGAKSIDDINFAFNALREDLLKFDFELWDTEDSQIIVHNIVVTSDISHITNKQKINLSRLMMSLPFERTEYEPEQFPGLIYRMSEPEVVYLIFSSGRCVITGSKNIEEAEEAERLLIQEIQSVYL